METKNARVVRGRTELWVPHNAGEIAFAYPSAGPNSYREVRKEILNRGQKIPTGSQTSSLLYAAYCIPEVESEPEFENVRSIMRGAWLWLFNRNLWVENGVYVLQDTQAIGRGESLDVNKLEIMLKNGKEIEGVRFSEDGTLRFAPKETYNLGEQTPEVLAKNGFVIASCGRDGAEKIADASAKFKRKPYVNGVETKKPEQRVSALDGYGGLRLDFGGLNFDDAGLSHAFGVLE